MHTLVAPTGSGFAVVDLVQVEASRGPQANQANQPSGSNGLNEQSQSAPRTGGEGGRWQFGDFDELAEFVVDRELEGDEPTRWVWDTRVVYPGLVARGVRVERAHDLRLVGRLLVGAGVLPEAMLLPDAQPTEQAEDGLFEVAPAASVSPAQLSTIAYAQLEALPRADAEDRRGAMRTLAAAESSGALIAVEMRVAGLPFNVEEHDRMLSEALGERGAGGQPARLIELAAEVREKLNAPRLHVESAKELLDALRGAGIEVRSTRKWELQGIDHPAIAPLLEYKRLYRLFTANGWAWAEAWVRDGRLHPEFVPGGVVSGRWASTGGGALQLPKEVRGAVRADEGWKLVVADAAQLEPRILAAVSRDGAMAKAGQQADMYQAFVDQGVVPTRPAAKVAMLGAMYGATTGESARLLPSLGRAFPRAMAHVEHAAKAGERGEWVRTWLGRTSPLPHARFNAREWGRFTRNFVIQGTAAEWALVWMAGIRQGLARIGQGEVALSDLESDAHLVYFLHDEVVVHAPAEIADEVARVIEQAAEAAGRTLFADAPVSFPVQVAIVDRYSEAK